MGEKHEFGTPMEILEEALRRENAAYQFYASVRDHVKTELVRDLAEQLCEEERRHAQLIEQYILKIRLG